jgi:pyruvate/2-oxoglutarate dehydrogenase complex dihydrolipoamide acyltransferase (E2) component
MGEIVKMPQLGETVTEGTILRWLVSVGDVVKEDDPILEISTDKVDTEVPSPFAGEVTALLVEEGETVEVGVSLMELGGDGNSTSEKPKEEVEVVKENMSEKIPEVKIDTTETSTQVTNNRDQKLSPIVRKLANKIILTFHRFQELVRIIVLLEKILKRYLILVK